MSFASMRCGAAIAAICCLLISSPTSSHAATIDVEFSDLAVGQTFSHASLPRTITTNGVDVGLSSYGGSSGANGRIIDATLFGASNNALFLAANLRAEIVLSSPSSGGFFFFRNQGGVNLLEINGQTLNFTHSSLAGSTFSSLGAVSIHSSALTGSYRSVKLDGVIHKLAFIGQELTVDSVQLSLFDGPASPGDYDRNGQVDGRDFLIWQRGGSPQAMSTSDLSEWSGHFSSVTSTILSSTAVPEPIVMGWCAPAALLLLNRRRRATRDRR